MKISRSLFHLATASLLLATTSSAQPVSRVVSEGLVSIGPPLTIAVDQSGNTYYGGTGMYPGVYKIDPNGVQSQLPTYDTLRAGFLTSIAVSPLGNIVIAGYNTAFPLLGTHPPNLQSNGTGFVAKFSPQGDQLYQARVNGVPFAVAVDSAEAVYITGTADASFQATTGAVQPTIGNPSCSSDPVMTDFCHNAFVTKLNPDGSIASATFLGGGGNDAGTAIAVDAQGSVYVAGQTQSLDFPVTPGAMQPINGAAKLPGSSNATDAFLARLDRTGSKLIFSTYLGGSGFDTAAGVAIDTDGSVFVVGSTSSSDFPVTANAYQATYGSGSSPSGSNAFYAKLNALGNAQFASYLGAPGTETGVALAFQPGGPLYLGVIGPLQKVLSPPLAACNTQGTLVVIDPASGGLKDFNDLPGAYSLSAGALAVLPDGVTEAAVSDTPAPGGFTNHSGQSLLQVDFTRQDLFVPTCVVNATTGVQSGSLGLGETMSIYGTNIGPAVPVSATPNPDYPTQLSGVAVSYGGVPLPLLYVSSNRVDAMSPYEPVDALNNQLVIRSGSYQASSLFSIAIVMNLFSRDSSGQAAALNQDGTQNSPDNPAEPGSIVSLFATGLELVSSLPGTVSLTVRCCSSGASIQYLGIAPGEPLGVYQINTQIPQTAPQGQNPISLAVESYFCNLLCSSFGDQPTIIGYDSNVVQISVK